MAEQDPTDYSLDHVGHALVPLPRPEEVEEVYEETRPQFIDFAGLDQEIDRLKEVGAIFAHPDLAEEWDVDVPTGILLCGPGGVGKTELVRAFSREIEAELVEIKVSDIQSMWVGKSNENLRDVFKCAGTAEGRVVMLFDELDGLFSQNAGGNQGVALALISEMKMQLSNLRRDHPGIIVAATTNSLSGFDEALLRPGRFDVVLQIPKPNDVARAGIFGAVISSRMNLYNLGDITGEKRMNDSIDINSLAAATEGMTGADIKAILHTARTKRLMANLQRGIELNPISQSDVIQAIKQHRQQRMNAVD